MSLRTARMFPEISPYLENITATAQNNNDGLSSNDSSDDCAGDKYLMAEGGRDSSMRCTIPIIWRRMVTMMSF